MHLEAATSGQALTHLSLCAYLKTLIFRSGGKQGCRRYCLGRIVLGGRMLLYKLDRPLYDEKTERLCVRRMIAGALSKVSKEVGGSLRDSVNAFDPCKVAGEVESVLFDNWGFRDASNYDKYEAIIHFLILDEIKEFRRQVLVGEIPPEMLLNMSFEQLQQRYPRTPSYLDYIAPK